jgi:L-lactate utilization protein LutC
MANIKHVGQVINTQKRVIVVFREIPDEPESCLVVDTDAAPDWMHDDLITAVESNGAQASANFYEYAQRSVFTDGSNMLTTLHEQGRLNKHPTKNIAMTPNNSVSVNLAELNTMIATETGGAPVVVPDDTEFGNAGMDAVPDINAIAQATPEAEAVIDDGDLAKNMLAQAEGFLAEAETLKAQAYDLDPSLKPKRGRPAKVTAE